MIRPMIYLTTTLKTGLILFLLIAGQNSFAAAGRIVFATGKPLAVDTAGTQRTLKRGDEVFSGDTLQTVSNSRLQVSFADGAYISVQPNSEYKIEEYNYAGKPDGSEKSVYRLLKGGVRAVTGLIGKERPEAYKVNTAVATIGIRGTGHNTRICQGDCGKTKDGLYHNTWEGTTFVQNDVDEVEVPAGNGVFVKDPTSKIQFLSQPPAVTAVETTKEREEEQKEEEDRSTVFVAGEQRNSEGLQRIVVDDNSILPTSSKVLLDHGVIGVSPDTEDAALGDDFQIFNSSIFINDNKEVVGILGTEDDDEGSSSVRVLGTIDLNALLGGDDPASVAEIFTLLETVSQADLDLFTRNPASVAESQITPGGIGWGRWAGGNVLTLDADGDNDVLQLSGHQSVHFVYGPEPPPFAGATGSATYNFIGGTQSTSVSGATIGNGVIANMGSPNINVNFSTSSASIMMYVDHIDIYQINGTLIVDAVDNEIFDNSVTAVNMSMTGACYPGCATILDGGFAGSLDPAGHPIHIGIEYEIQETDVITGVAAFTKPP